jgi:hypothetical protein
VKFDEYDDNDEVISTWRLVCGCRYLNDAFMNDLVGTHAQFVDENARKEHKQQKKRGAGGIGMEDDDEEDEEETKKKSNPLLFERKQSSNNNSSLAKDGNSATVTANAEKKTQIDVSVHPLSSSVNEAKQQGQQEEEEEEDENEKRQKQKKLKQQMDEVSPTSPSSMGPIGALKRTGTVRTLVGRFAFRPLLVLLSPSLRPHCLRSFCSLSPFLCRANTATEWV